LTFKKNRHAENYPNGIKSSSPALTDEIGGVGPDRDKWKLASYDVAGEIVWEMVSPGRTLERSRDSTVSSGRISLAATTRHFVSG
jgi:hypothetical protein